MGGFASFVAMLSLLQALACGGAEAAAELSEECGDCAAAMRVELLQHRAQTPEDPTALTLAAEGSPHVLSLTKSTLALSHDHTGKSKAFKRFFLPVITESEMGENPPERDTFLEEVRMAIAEGAGRPDEWEGSSLRFDQLSTPRDCGQDSRFRLEKTEDDGMARFALHGVYASGNGSAAGSRREVGGLTVRDVEDVFQRELGDLREYSPWMDVSSAAFFDRDLDYYAHRFSKHGVSFLVLRWPSASSEQQPLYSLITHVPDTQEVFEIISATAPSDPALTVKEFPMPRHVFEEGEVEWLMDRKDAVQLHVSRTHRDLDAVKAHYKNFFNLDPIFEMRDPSTGVGFASFCHQSIASSYDPVRVQVMYWNRPDQSMTKVHTTDWLESRLEQINAEYMKSYTSCWPVWGDNHYTVENVNGNYFEKVRQEYDEAGMGYMLFNNGENTMGGYFPLPGGFYIEMQPNNPVAERQEGALEWSASYCYAFECAA
jgi:hypothetical protein